MTPRPRATRLFAIEVECGDTLEDGDVIDALLEIFKIGMDHCEEAVNHYPTVKSEYYDAASLSLGVPFRLTRSKRTEGEVEDAEGC
jgi:hypothetical protein